MAKALIDAHTRGVTVLAGLTTSPHAEDIGDLYEPWYRRQEDADDHDGRAIGEEIGIHTQRKAREQRHDLALLLAIDEIPSPYGAEED